MREFSFIWQASNLESSESCCTAGRSSVESGWGYPEVQGAGQCVLKVMLWESCVVGITCIVV